ncbi:MAG: radical SAM protein, partial [Myxococcales bacterium]|nr:radical SAM protein [Myxococcales bacterium]
MDPSARIERIAARTRGRERDPLRAIAADAAAKGGRLRGPLEVTVEVTRDCAGGCVFCVQAARRDRRHVAVDRFADLVRALAAAGVARLRLTGGEPSAHPRLAELVALA